MTTRRQVLVICTGGTFALKEIGSEWTMVGSQGAHRKFYESSNKLLPEINVLMWPGEQDSCMMTPSNWATIAEQIEENYYNYDGFVVLHGTDTMAYSASAVSFMLENLAKPIVFTGAQVRLKEMFSDARQNLVSALLIAANMDIPEVCICFANRLTRANRTTRLDAWRQDAFLSPSHSNLAHLGIDIEVKEPHIMNHPKRRFSCSTNLCAKNIIVFTVIPQLNYRLLDHFINSLSKDETAIILACYGAGNAPLTEKGLISVLRSAQKKCVPVVITTQCVKGAVNMELYSSAEEFSNLGVIDAKDMTIESCVTKLSYLMGKGYRNGKLKTLMESDLRGELSSTEFHIPHYQLQEKIQGVYSYNKL